MENLENEKCISQTWKNHGISKNKKKKKKKNQNHGKVMEFQTISTENHGKNFWRSTHSVQY